MTLSEETLRKAAAGCFDNAESHCGAARVLFESRFNCQAVALATIGVEEFAKSLVYAVAALMPNQRTDIPPRIDGHYAKHRVALWAEGSQIMLSEGFAVFAQESGHPYPMEDRLAEYLGDLSRIGVRELVGASRAEHRERDKSARQEYEALEREFPGSLTGPSMKNAALYVDVADGRVLIPDRVSEEAAGQINELRWFLKEFVALSDVLSSDQAWDAFASRVRRDHGPDSN